MTRPSPVQLMSAADAVRAAEKLRQVRANQDNWPYPHIYPPVDSIPVERVGSVVTPAVAAAAVALTYTVPSGYNFVLRAVLVKATGAASFTPGDATFSLTLNRDPSVTSIIGSTVQGLTNVPIPLGNWTVGLKWHLERSYEFAPLDVLRWLGTNVAYGVGAPNYFVGGLFGWLLPSVKE